jgi:hypothetical protein
MRTSRRPFPFSHATADASGARVPRIVLGTVLRTAGRRSPRSGASRGVPHGVPPAGPVRRAFPALIVALLCCALPGDSQVPGDGPPDSLRTAEDCGALRVSLESLAAGWRSTGTPFVLSQLRFHPAVQAGGVRVYLGEVERTIATPGLALPGAPLPTTTCRHTFAYVHQIGGPCAIPPDALYLSSGAPRPFGRASRETLTPGLELDFFLAILGELEGVSGGGGLAPIVAAWQATPTWAITNLTTAVQESALVGAIEFTDLASPGAPPILFPVSAPIMAGACGEVVTP